jgi:hypothetical protein
MPSRLTERVQDGAGVAVLTEESDYNPDIGVDTSVLVRTARPKIEWWHLNHR